MEHTPNTTRAKRALILLIPILVNLLCAYAPAQDQPTLSKPLHLRWVFETNGAANITPAAVEEVIYVPLSDGVVVSLGAADGELLWKSEIGGRISASPDADLKGVYVASESFQPHSSPYPQATGALRALSRQSGVTMWMRTLPSPVRGALT